VICSVPYRTGTLRSLAIALVATVLGACARHTVQRDGSNPCDNTGSGKPHPTPELGATYTNTSGDDLHAFVTSTQLDFTQGKHWTRHRKKCSSGTGNCSTGDSATITICPEQGARDIGQVNATKTYVDLSGGQTNTYVIAKLWDDANSPSDDWLGLTPGDTAYWIIEPDANGHAQSLLVELHQQNGKWQKVPLLPNQTVLFFPCNHKLKDQVEADFGKCLDHKGPDDTVNLADRGYPDRGQGREPSGDVTATWISCVAGCCSTSSAQQFPQSRRPAADSSKIPQSRPPRVDSTRRQSPTSAPRRPAA
jgi:hypothetical protein